MLSACEKFQGEGYRLSKHQTCFGIYCCVASPTKGCWKGWLLLSSASLPGWLMMFISLSFSLEKTWSRDRCTRSPETERARGPGGGGGADTSPPQEALILRSPPPPTQHPPIVPSSASSFSSRAQAPQAFYFTVTAGEQQVQKAEIMYSKLSFCFILNWSVSLPSTQPSSRREGEGKGAGRACECRWPASWLASSTITGWRGGRTSRPDITQ